MNSIQFVGIFFMRVVQKVNSGELLTKQEMKLTFSCQSKVERLKDVIICKGTYILKLLLNIGTTGT
jgi:hypothetical protein